eukprot:UN33567
MLNTKIEAMTSGCSLSGVTVASNISSTLDIVAILNYYGGLSPSEKAIRQDLGSDYGEITVTTRGNITPSGSPTSVPTGAPTKDPYKFGIFWVVDGSDEYKEVDNPLARTGHTETAELTTFITAVQRELSVDY